MPIFGKIKGSKVEAKLWLPIHEVESGALDKIRAVASLEDAVDVAIMPDCHDGRGSCVGAVIAMKGAIIPSFVGSDIGCGMCALKTNLKASDLPDSLRDVRLQIERDIPHGFYSHKEVDEYVKGYNHLWGRFLELTPKVHKLFDKAQLQLGTLGGGNHFIEVCLDKEDNVWVMLHSGSRNIGKEIADVHINKDDMRVLKEGTPEFRQYWNDAQWAQEYAMINRSEMVRRILKGLTYKLLPQMQFTDYINCHHNYATREMHNNQELIIIRKGAIRAGLGCKAIIPGSMGTRSYIVKGLGNLDSMCSASHGAGRKMSRSKAKKTFTKEDIEKQLQGVESRRDEGIIDELPGAYKPIDEVMANECDLVEPIVELHQILCVKG